jgi:hypothetical protein
LPAGIQLWDDFFGVEIVFRSAVLTFEKQLEFRCQIGSPIGGSKHGLVPRDLKIRITPIDPAVGVAVADGQIQTPWLLHVRPSPHVVLTSFHMERLPIPGNENSGRGYLEIPPSEG